MNNQYRIVEHHGKFQIQTARERIEVSGFLFWKKGNVVMEWVHCLQDGSPYDMFYDIRNIIPPFDKLADAVERVQIFMKPDQHYDHEGKPMPPEPPPIRRIKEGSMPKKPRECNCIGYCHHLIEED